ncbi:hypothetical protein JXA56_05745 [Candidatus Micrarchaeota archaeon]|nr:hypothetical protein [Candidatus Micrarchaeota archaeon]
MAGILNQRAVQKERDSIPDSGIRRIAPLTDDNSGIIRRPPARRFSTKVLEAVKDAAVSVRRLAYNFRTSIEDPDKALDALEQTPTPPSAVFAQYKPKPESAAVFRIAKG